MDRSDTGYSWLDGAADWVAEAARIDSPNHDARPEGVGISLLVIHSISLPPGHFGNRDVVDLFLNRLNPAAHPDYLLLSKLRVSAHFFIRRDGELIQFVPCSGRAWHAGLSSWHGVAGCNDYSLGIELEGSESTPFAEVQYQTLLKLVQLLRGRWGPLEITGHQHIAPGRKSDPGVCFDWSRVAQFR